MKSIFFSAVLAGLACGVSLSGAALSEPTISVPNSEALQGTAVSRSSAVDTPAVGAIAPFWIPFRVSTASYSGVIVIPSNNLSATPSFLTRESTAYGGAAASNYTVSHSYVTQASPALILYAGVGPDKKVHFYRASLSGTTIPTPVQVSSFSTPSLSAVCPYRPWYSLQTNLQDPTTLTVLVEIAGTGGCDPYQSKPLSETWVLFHATDASTKAVTTLNISPGEVDPLYLSGGMLGRIAVLDRRTKNFSLYADTTFTKPVTVVTGASYVQQLLDSQPPTPIIVPNLATDDFAFYVVPTGNGSTSGSDTLYRVSATGTIELVYRAAGSLGESLTGGSSAADLSNLYFSDTTSSATNIYQVPLKGGTAPLKLLADTRDETADFVGSNGKLLVMQLFDGVTDEATLATVPVGRLSSSTTTLTKVPGAAATHSFMLPKPPVLVPTAASANLAAADIYISSNNTESTSSEVITPTGGQVQASLANSQFSGPVSILEDSVSQLRGRVVARVNSATHAVTAFDGVDGEPFTIPSSTEAAESDIALYPLSTTIGAGFYVLNGDPAGAVAYDTSKNLMVEVKVSGGSVLPGFN